jgi:tetratricopeptide (TPR) repeat protein
VTLRRLAAALALFALGAPGQASDTLCLKDGRIFDDVVLQRGEGVILVKFENGQASVPLDRVLECVIENDTAFVPATEEEKQKVAEGLVLFEGKWVKPAERDARLKKLVAEKRETVEKLKQSRLWRNRIVAETKDFTVEYTVPTPVFADCSERMEAYFAEFVKRWKIKKPRDLAKLKVRFYAEPDDFYQVTGMPRGVLAFFEPVEPPYRLQFYYDRLDPMGVERDMLHEFGHYIQKLVDTGFSYPHWPGESLAEYYSTASYDPATKKITIEPVVLEERLIEIQRDIEEGERVGLEELIRNGNKGEYHDYTWGWSLVYFLMSKPETAKKFEDFYLGLARSRSVSREGVSALKNYRADYVEGEEMLASFKKEMGLKRDSDVRALEIAWHDALQDDMRVTSSRGLARAAQMARRFDRKHRAKRLYEEAIAAGDATALTHHRYAELLEDMDEHAAAREHWAKAVELDPLVPEFYIAWGKSLLDEAATKEEGKRLLKLAQEIEPENLYLEQHLEELLAK